MDLEVRTQTIGPDSNQGFIVKPSQITEVGCTLDLANTTADGNYVPAGRLLGRITATGLYGDYDTAAADGRETFAGALFDTIPTRGKTEGNVGASRIVIGAVYTAKLPQAVDAAAANTDLPTIAFV